MRGLLLEDAPTFRTDLAEVQAGVDEAVVRVLRAGICNTDLELARGYMNFRGVPGHEFVGQVESCAADPTWVGARVVGEINCGCNMCERCRGGDSRHCPDRTVLGILRRNGTFAERIVLPLRNLHRVPDGVSTARAVFAEPLAAAFSVTDLVWIRPTDRVAVLGDGKLGLLVAQVVARTGCALVAVGKHEERLDILRRQGVAIAHLSTWQARREQYDIVVECSGQVDGVKTALAALRPRGTLVLKTTCADALTMNLAPIVIDEVRVVGSRCGPFAPALRALESGAVDVDSLTHRVFPLEEAEEALRHAARPGVLKVMLEP